ncbi:MAG: sensor domain-containing diguanylate cyclase [Aeromicrobium sp.]
MTFDVTNGPSDTYVRGMERLMRAVQELSLARELEQVQHIVRTTARDLAGSDGATFILREDDQCYYADEDAIEPLWKGSRFPLGACVSGWTMVHKQVAVIEDIYVDDRVLHDAYRPTFVKSLVMVPIRSLDPIGAIGNYWADGHLATDDEIRLLQVLADATSIAMGNIAVYTELERRVVDRTAALERANHDIQVLSVTDPLTTLLNRRGFFDEAERRLASAATNGTECLVAFIDVDGLKEVNDEHGHVVGDAMLVHVAQVLRSVVRGEDLLARVGGDEFCIFMHRPPVDAAALVGRLADRLEHVGAELGLPYPLAASIGTATSTERPGSTMDGLVLAADERMYEHKRSRRRTG